jgi:hypothetical protein
LQISAEFITSAAGNDDFPEGTIARGGAGRALERGQVEPVECADAPVAGANQRGAWQDAAGEFLSREAGSGGGAVLVDLPGYGYARGGDASAQEFNRLAESYFPAPGIAG